MIGRLQTLDCYKKFRVDRSRLTIYSPEMQIFSVRSFERMQEALSALKDLHDNNVIHGDVKRDHIRTYVDEAGKERVCFVDFGCSGGRNEWSKGHTWSHASFERLLPDSKLSPIDDYEALFVTALFPLGLGDFLSNLRRDPKSNKANLRLQLELMAEVARMARNAKENEYIGWLGQKLMLIWQQPRDDPHHEEKLLPLLADRRVVPMEQFEQEMRDRLLTKFKAACTLSEVQETLPEDVPKSGERLHGCLLRNAVASAQTPWYSGTAHVNGESVAEYDSVLVLKGLSENPSIALSGQRDPKTLFPTLKQLAGQVVIGEAGHGNKSIWYLLNKIDFLNLRPLEYLLLFVGIHVSAQRFAPMQARYSDGRYFYGDAQCLELVSKQDLAQRQFLADQLGGTINESEVKRATNTRYPCVGLATLIVAGRLFVENWGEVPQSKIVESVSTMVKSTTAKNAILEQKVEDLQQGMEALQLERQLEREAMQQQKQDFAALQQQVEVLTQLLQQNSRSSQCVWVKFDGGNATLHISSPANVGEFQQTLSLALKSKLLVFAPNANPQRDQPLPPNAPLPQTFEQ